MRLALGTAQFGLDYGITNRRGQIERSEAERILEAAGIAGVTTIDTASAYGNVESFLGGLRASQGFRIVSKIAPQSAKLVAHHIEASAARLKSNGLDTVLLHDATVLSAAPEIWGALSEAKSSGRVARIGASLYYPSDWRQLVAYCDSSQLPYPDSVQLPLSVFDQRFIPILSEMKETGCEIFARSVFLQGLGFLSEDSIPSYFKTIASTIQGLSWVEKSTASNRAATLLSFPLAFREVDYVVVGVDGLDTFDQNVTSYRRAEQLAVELRPQDWSHLKIDDDSILIPMNWPSKGAV